MINRVLSFFICTTLFVIMAISPAYSQQNEAPKEWNEYQIIRAKVLDVKTETETKVSTEALEKEKNK